MLSACRWPTAWPPAAFSSTGRWSRGVTSPGCAGPSTRQASRSRTSALCIDAPEDEFEVQPAEAPNELQAHNRNAIMGEFLYAHTLTVQGCRPDAGLGAQGGVVGAAAAPAVHSIADVPEGEGQGALAALSVCIDTATKSPVPDRWPCGLVRQRDRATTSDSEEASLDKFIAWAAPGLLLSAALASCAQPRRPDAPPPGLAAERCTPGICELKVTVTNCHSATGITVDKPLVEATSAVNMRWTIVTPGFEFDTDGIRFDPANPQFERQPSPRRNEFRIQNKKSRDGDFYYFIHVKGCEVADPWVRNTR